jgi:SP family general alpha glucoside:H+ symporter-like MFS transporter
VAVHHHEARRELCQSSVIPANVKTIITEVFATTWWHFLLAKVWNGFAAGLIGTSVLSYASEAAMPQLRGTIISAYAFFFALGQLGSAIGLQIISTVRPPSCM